MLHSYCCFPGKITEHYHAFALFDSSDMGNFMTPWGGSGYFWFRVFCFLFRSSAGVLWSSLCSDHFFCLRRPKGAHRQLRWWTLHAKLAKMFFDCQFSQSMVSILPTACFDCATTIPLNATAWRFLTVCGAKNNAPLGSACFAHSISATIRNRSWYWRIKLKL